MENIAKNPKGGGDSNLKLASRIEASTQQVLQGKKSIQDALGDLTVNPTFAYLSSQITSTINDLEQESLDGRKSVRTAIIEKDNEVTIPINPSFPDLVTGVNAIKINGIISLSNHPSVYEMISESKDMYSYEVPYPHSGVVTGVIVDDEGSIFFIGKPKSTTAAFEVRYYDKELNTDTIVYNADGQVNYSQKVSPNKFVSPMIGGSSERHFLLFDSYTKTGSSGDGASRRIIGLINQDGKYLINDYVTTNKYNLTMYDLNTGTKTVIIEGWSTVQTNGGFSLDENRLIFISTGLSCYDLNLKAYVGITIDPFIQSTWFTNYTPWSVLYNSKMYKTLLGLQNGGGTFFCEPYLDENNVLKIRKIATVKNNVSSVIQSFSFGCYEDTIYYATKYNTNLVNTPATLTYYTLNPYQRFLTPSIPGCTYNLDCDIKMSGKVYPKNIDFVCDGTILTLINNEEFVNGTITVPPK